MTGTVIGIFCVAAFLFIIGIVLISGHGSFLIAGYNTMKPEEQENNLCGNGPCGSVLYENSH